jgi:hypothetical protein
MKSFTILIFVSLIISCSPKKSSEIMSKYDTIPGTFAYDLAFLKKNNKETIVLSDAEGQAKLIIIPGWQARVMTSTASGDSGFSYGWINYKLIESGEFIPHMNAFGGEERVWLGPEGGPYSVYFAPGVKQEFANWFVPSVLDTAGFELISKSETKASFRRIFSLTNYSGTEIHACIQRSVSLLDRNETDSLFGIKIPEGVKNTTYKSENQLMNHGEIEWNQKNGLLSIWMLSMLTPSPGVTIFIPYNEKGVGPVVNDDYFGKVPGDRLKSENGIIWFKADGKFRSKIGIPPERATNYAGSYDSDNNILTVLCCDIPAGNTMYLNSKWGEQKDPFSGDVINAYNDGPVEDGSQMGPFYELESSSPGAVLKKAESLIHTQVISHFEGNPASLSEITENLFGVTVEQINSAFE